MGYPANNGSWYMDLSISVSYNVDGSQYILPISAVSEIAANQRQAVKDAIGFYMVYIGAKFFSVPPPATVNQVVVPVSVLATLALVGVAFAFRHKHRDEETKTLMRQRREAVRSRNRIGAADGAAVSQQARPQNGALRPENGTASMLPDAARMPGKGFGDIGRQNP
uniref:CcmF_C domain-containing protein n=1 Tax=Macrostomum lignano TaxID=282301 RepID=A0A1I8JDV9_9PLAT